MTEEKQKFDYDALLVRVVEQAARVLPYFDEGSQEQAETATLFKELESHLRAAQAPSPEPRLERHHIQKALDTRLSLEARLRDLGVPTNVKEAFSREMQPILDRFFKLMEQYPSLEDKLIMREFEQSKNVDVPEEWTERLLKKIREESENPTVKRSH